MLPPIKQFTDTDWRVLDVQRGEWKLMKAQYENREMSAEDQNWDWAIAQLREEFPDGTDQELNFLLQQIGWE